MKWDMMWCFSGVSTAHLPWLDLTKSSFQEALVHGVLGDSEIFHICCIFFAAYRSYLYVIIHTIGGKTKAMLALNFPPPDTNTCTSSVLLLQTCFADALLEITTALGHGWRQKKAVNAAKSRKD